MLSPEDDIDFDPEGFGDPLQTDSGLLEDAIRESLGLPDESLFSSHCVASDIRTADGWANDALRTCAHELGSQAARYEDMVTLRQVGGKCLTIDQLCDAQAQLGRLHHHLRELSLMNRLVTSYGFTFATDEQLHFYLAPPPDFSTALDAHPCGLRNESHTSLRMSQISQFLEDFEFHPSLIMAACCFAVESGPALQRSVANFLGNSNPASDSLLYAFSVLTDYEALSTLLSSHRAPYRGKSILYWVPEALNLLRMVRCPDIKTSLINDEILRHCHGPELLHIIRHAADCPALQRKSASKMGPAEVEFAREALSFTCDEETKAILHKLIDTSNHP